MKLSHNVWYRIILTVTDALGSKGKDSVDVFPLKSTLQFSTDPAGLQITLDGQPFNTPGSVVSVEGIIRTLGVISPQTLNNQSYEFESWSHGGATNSGYSDSIELMLRTLLILGRHENTFYRAINLNGPALSIDGNNWEASAAAPNFAVTFGVPVAAQNVTPVPATDANRATMMRSFFWYQPNITINAVPPGAYQVWVYVFEDNNPVTYSILLEGNVVQTNYNSGSAGTWRKLGPFSATINDGNIKVRSTTIEANFSGVEIWRAGQPVSPPTITNPLVDQIATVDTPFSYTFLANTFTPSQPGNTLSYSASLDNGTNLPSWLTFNPATRTFSGTPNNTNVGTLNISVTASETTGGTVSDVFSLNVSDGPTAATFYRAINLNGPALSIDGNNWEASAGAPNFAVTFGVPAAAQNVTPVPATDANRATMMRSFFWYQPDVTINAVPPGAYQVWVYVFEDNFPVTYSILLEGTVVQTNYNSGSAGTWRKLGPFSATINDGTINVRSTSHRSKLFRCGNLDEPGKVQVPLVYV